jgi:hypothetical protein
MITNVRTMARQAQGFDAQASIVVGFFRALQRLFAAFGPESQSYKKVASSRRADCY